MNRTIRSILQILLGLCTAVCIICAAVTVTLNCGPLYDADIRNYALEERTGMSYEEIRAEFLYDLMAARRTGHVKEGVKPGPAKPLVIL